MKMSDISAFACQVCAADRLAEVDGFARLKQVTSDAKPFTAGGRLTICRSCGAIQKLPTTKWFEDIHSIYAAYDIYYQSDGIEQAVFDAVTGKPIRRSVLISRRLEEQLVLPSTGRLLDVGCGSGAFLSGFAEVKREWELCGLDLDSRNLQKLESIPGFQKLLTCQPAEVVDKYDLITMIHSLEHFATPLEILTEIRRVIAPGGRLLIQVPDIRKTPFDLVVADHLLHFTSGTLEYLVSRAGFQVELITTKWVDKEITLIARTPSQRPTLDKGGQKVPSGTADGLLARIQWLEGGIDAAKSAASQGNFGIFGTSIAATWLYGCLGEVVEFFVDEDPSRKGRKHMGRAILQPAEVAPRSIVYVALVPPIDEQVVKRLGKDFPIEFRLAPKPALAWEGFK